MPISTLWAKSMPSILSRKPWTKCCRACSPSVTMSTPESSCSFTASRVASRLARESSAPDDFQGAHSVFGSASHSGFGSEPAMVVGNSMGASRDMWLSACLPCLMVEVQNYKSVVQPDDDRDSEIKIGNPNDRILLRLLQPLAKEFSEEIVWRPILVGGIFNTINPSVYATRDNTVPAKLAYQKKDMADWARSEIGR